jgi:phenylacetate-CoA ligase
MARAVAARSAYWDEAVETLSRDALDALQLERLRAQVARCQARSAFYRERLRSAGLQANDIHSLAELAGIPVVTKEELRAEQVASPPLGRFVVAPPETWRELHPSTGTTGVPVNTIWSANDVATIAEFTARTLWQFGARPGDVIQNAFAYGLWVAGLSVHYAAARIGALCVPTGAAIATQRQLDFLTTPGSTVLIATPSYGMHIAEVLAERGIEPESLALRLGCFGGEAGTENAATRAKLERGLGIEAFDYYGLAEVGPTFASECAAKDGLHFAEDHVLVECLDPETKRPVGDGEIGVLVFTHLTREAAPMLRYWSNDYARLDRRRCACGRTHVRAPGGILGRHDDLVIFKGAKFYPVQVERVVRSFAELADEFRIELARAAPGSSQVATCVVVAEWSRAGPVDGFTERLRNALRTELGVRPQVRIEPFGTLERTTFKAKRLVDLAAR